MVIKKNTIHKKQKRTQKKRQTQKKRGGKNPDLINWKKGEWSEDPILTRFITTNYSQNICEYGLSWIYHYLDENEEKERKALTILTNHNQIMKNESENYRKCELTEEKIWGTLKQNSELKDQINLKKKEIETQIKKEVEKNKKINEELSKLQKNGTEDEITESEDRPETDNKENVERKVEEEARNLLEENVRKQKEEEYKKDAVIINTKDVNVFETEINNITDALNLYKKFNKYSNADRNNYILKKLRIIEPNLIENIKMTFIEPQEGTPKTQDGTSTENEKLFDKIYKKLATKYHPDKNKTPYATNIFQDLGNKKDELVGGKRKTKKSRK